jgi:hypothetical protein
MSFIAPVLAEMIPLADALDAVTEELAADGVLMFSSSGNGGGHLDEIVAERPGLFGTRPCQSPGVICVGGLDWDSNVRHPDSVHSDPGGSVDLYAPYCVFTYPVDSRQIEMVCGTSLSTPFVAGVAALVWASDPTLTSDEVWDLIQSTLLGDEWPRVNALGAVAAALGSFANVVFVEPEEASQDLGRALTLAAMVALPSDIEAHSTEVLVRFSSDRDGLISETTWTVPFDHDGPVSLQRVSTVTDALSEGEHVLTVEAVWDGASASDQRVITVGNRAPSDLEINQPDDGSEFCAGAAIRFRGDAFDINQQLGLPDGAFVWRSDVDGRIGSGRSVSTTSLSAGSHAITMRVTDEGGLTSRETIGITVLPTSHSECIDLPPTVEIVEPLDGASFYVDDPDAETGVDEHGAWVMVTVRVEVTDDRDGPSGLEPLITVIPGEEYSVQGSGYELEIKLHLPDGMCSQRKWVKARSEDSSGNRSEDEIEVFVNRFC